jgi:hypothetical protein
VRISQRSGANASGSWTARPTLGRNVECRRGLA